MTTSGSASTPSSAAAWPVPTSASPRARLAATASVLGLRQVNALLPNNRAGIRIGRGLIAAVMAAGGPTLPGTHVTPVRADGVRGEWVRAAGVEHGDRAIYYIHGSGYVVCSARTHRGLASRLSRRTGLPVFVLDYRLAPEHPFPAAADDVAAGYRWLLAHGYRARDLVIGGDSAGCHLSLDLLLQNHDSAVPQPAGVFMFSPLLDPTLTLAAERDRRRPDPMAPAWVGRRMIAHYTATAPAGSPRLRLTVPPGAPLPPLYIQASAGEMLAGDARQLHDMAVAAGVRCDLELWPGRIHVFQALPLLVPEAVPALRRTADFVAGAFARADTDIRQQVS
ncbi:alpha/beta hydrolase [Nocardia terpenica]|uniref:Alpha/beta hydrolase n=1 Tax=Nocardia terpenica TaxID=455432 RepID=A0A164LJ12_9NOCA|nr:alpha/beta hydrolase [Nocardia terpenica]KZM72465.1 alpha/beta hydrolase [Nocardia terpenica]NQE92668.1 alpha/beta hydrolase [Nocardia terpenica]